MQSINSDFSTKIKILSVLSMIGVLYVHAYFFEAEKWEWVNLFQTLTNYLARYAVPSFFIISGYLFFYKTEKVVHTYPKIKKRCRTLLVPYIIWCFVFILFMGIISCLTPTNGDWLSLLKNGEIVRFLSFVFIEPAAFHLWFIRDLFLLVLLSPLLYLALYYAPLITFVGILSLIIGVGQQIFIIQALLFFTIGGWYGLNNRVPFMKLPAWTGVPLFIISYLLLVYYHLNPEENINQIVILFYTIGIWKCLDIIPRNKLKKLLLISEFNFAIYCAHIPLLSIVKHLPPPMVLNSSIGLLLSYIFIPVVCVAILIPIFKMWKNISPSTYRLCTGGR